MREPTSEQSDVKNASIFNVPSQFVELTICFASKATCKNWKIFVEE